LLRIEDIDTPRTIAGADRVIMEQLRALGLHWDGEPVWQTRRHALYARAFERLRHAHRVYPCHCHRRDLPPGPYPGTCRPAPPGHPASIATPPARPPAHCSWRFQVLAGRQSLEDRWYGTWQQDVAAETGDFIIRRSDGLWAYQLVVVVDDGAQGVTDVVRGSDLLASTARQQQLAQALGLPLPRTLHVPVLCDTHGQKLSKQNHAPALQVGQPLACLRQAWQGLGFAPLTACSVDCFLGQATTAWAARFKPCAPSG